MIREGRSELLADVPDQLLEAVARNGEQLVRSANSGVAPAMVVPLRARGRTLGALSLVRAESPTSYGPEDLARAEQLAALFALAIDKARLYDQARLAERDMAEDVTSWCLRWRLTGSAPSAPRWRRDMPGMGPG